jgi:hypothetical protein
MHIDDAIEVSGNIFIDSRYGKQKHAYVAHIKGPGQEYALDRSFTKGRIAENLAALPKRDGVYEVRDYPDNTPRTRYYQVRGLEYREMETLGDDDVLDAVEASARGEWAVASDVPAELGIASTAEAMESLDECEINLIESFKRGLGLDEEDIAMEIDKVRKVLERL